jgi:hypothetical protein
VLLGVGLSQVKSGCAARGVGAELCCSQEAGLSQVNTITNFQRHLSSRWNLPYFQQSTIQPMEVNFHWSNLADES